MRSDTKGLPWTFKGVTAVGDCETAQDVIQKANLDFKVSKCPVYAAMPNRQAKGLLSFASDNNVTSDEDESFLYGGDKYKIVDNTYTTYRTDTLTPFGIVKSKYEPVQNIDAFKFFNDAIGENNAVWDTAGCFDGGRRIFVSAKLPGRTIVGSKDVIDNYLVFTNSHDGSSGVNIMFTPIRLICQNCLPGAIRAAKGQGTFLNFRHTQSVHSNINQALEILGYAKEQAEFMAIKFNELATKKMNDLQVMDYIASIHLNTEEYTKVKAIPNGMNLLFYRNHNVIEEANISSRKLNIICNTLDYYDNGPGQLEHRGTAWGAFNAITGFYSNIANLDGEKRMDSLIYGNAGNVMAKALEMVAL